MLEHDCIKLSRNETGIYFILSPACNAVKIGMSRSPRKRFNNIQSANPDGLVMLLCFRAKPHIEEKLHERFCKYHLRGEWFTYADEIREMVEEITEKCTDVIMLSDESRFEGMPSPGIKSSFERKHC